jgi:DNA-binding Lrp family transcriptional regulator
VTHPVDALDARIIELFAREPRVGVLEASRRLGVARGTVQARLDRLERSGVIEGWGPDLSAAALGFGVTAFATLELRQGVGHDTAARHLAAIPEVLEAYTITGPSDLYVRLVARSNADLQRVIDEVLQFDGIVRTSTVIALATQVQQRALPLLAKAVAEQEDS